MNHIFLLKYGVYKSSPYLRILHKLYLCLLFKDEFEMFHHLKINKFGSFRDIQLCPSDENLKRYYVSISAYFWKFKKKKKHFALKFLTHKTENILITRS